MFRIALLLSLASTSAIACEEFNISCNLNEAYAEKQAADRAERYHSDEMFMREREYEQRERLADDVDRRQQLIQGQMNQLNINTVPRY